MNAWQGAAAVAALSLLLAVLAAAGDQEPPPRTTSANAGTSPGTQSTCFRYAAPDGDDRAKGAVDQPFASAQRLVQALGRGQRGCLRRGEYRGDVEMVADGSVLTSAPGERAVLQVGSLSIPADVQDATISRLDIVGSGGSATVSLVGDGFVLERSDISNTGAGGTCLLVGASDHTTTGGTIRRNVVHGCGRRGENLNHGVYAQNVAPGAGRGGLLVEGNVLYDLASYAVQLYPRAVGVVVRDNVIDGGGRSIRGGIVLDGSVSADHTIEGNVIGRTRTGAVVQRTGTGHVSRGNCLWRNARGVSGNAISSTGDTASDRCWLPPDLWSRTGKAAADEPCWCPARGTTRCGRSQADSLCRLLSTSRGSS